MRPEAALCFCFTAICLFCGLAHTLSTIMLCYYSHLKVVLVISLSLFSLCISEIISREPAVLPLILDASSLKQMLFRGGHG